MKPVAAKRREQIDQKWLHPNLDGARIVASRDNRLVPVILYGGLGLSPQGLLLAATDFARRGHLDARIRLVLSGGAHTSTSRVASQARVAT
jgi:hypothetical protein